jgi:hypothetical protein
MISLRMAQRDLFSFPRVPLHDPLSIASATSDERPTVVVECRYRPDYAGLVLRFESSFQTEIFAK